MELENIQYKNNLIFQNMGRLSHINLFTILPKTIPNLFLLQHQQGPLFRSQTIIILPTMKTNFDINIPSIPSKIIKFKIQDIKSTAFGSQRNRFNENKGFLTKKFIESFNNFKEKEKEIVDTSETEAESQVSFKMDRTELQYRFLIPEEKKYMLHHYEKYRNYEAPMLKQTKYNRGYSFYKTDHLSLNKTKEEREVSHSIDDNHLTDNFYFPNRKDKSQEAPAKKHVQPSCVFKNETRKRVYTKLEKPVNAIPGPGAYLVPQQPKLEKIQRPKQQQAEPQFDYKNLKQIITNIVANEEQPVNEAKDELQAEQKKLNYMFIDDDRDRFGNQKYPIAFKLNVPGPGAYQIKDSLENNAKKVILVQQQRKLLKEWFNN